MLFGFCASWLGTSVRILQRTAPACPTYFSGVASTLKISCPPGASTELFNCSALSRPAVKASCPVAKPPFCSTTRFREAYSTNFHAIGFSPAFIFRLNGSAPPLDFRPVALTGIWSAGHGGRRRTAPPSRALGCRKYAFRPARARNHIYL